MIHIFDSTMAGAPVTSGTAGALKSVLKACFVDGFGATAVQSIVVAAGIATLNFASAHPLKEASVAEVSGASLGALNGKKKVLTSLTYSVTFAAPGAADGTYTGTISAKVAAVGWTELFPGTANVIALKPSVPEATGAVLRVDDTGTTASYVSCYTSMDDINTGADRCPNVTQSATGLTWWKSAVAGSSARSWRIIADERIAYIFLNSGANSNHHGMVFGDFKSVLGVDPYGFLINGAASSASNQTVSDVGYINHSTGFSTNLFCYIPKDSTGIGAPAPIRKSARNFIGEMYSGSISATLPFPNRRDNSLRLSEVDLIEAGGLCGTMPGIYVVPQNIIGVFSNGEILRGQGAFAGRKLLAVQLGDPSVTTTVGVVFIDVTDTWGR